VLRPCYTRQFFLQLATQRWRIKNLSSCRGGVTRVQFSSQFATRTITNKMADVLSRRHLAKDELWLAHSDKIALQVAEEMLHASNLEDRSTFLATRNATIAVAKWGCYTWIFSCNLQRNKCCVASCKKNCLDSLLFATLRNKLFACNIPSATCNAILSERANQSVPHLVCYCTRCKLRKKLQTCDTPLQLERFFIRHRCVASCKKNCFVYHGLN